MSVSPKEILDTAEKLRDGVPSESDMRSSASRAYYAALHAADLSIPDSFRETTLDESTHEATINKARRMSRSNGPGRTEAAQLFGLLPRFKRLRVKADYFIHENFDLDDCKRAIDQAIQALSLCNTISEKLEKRKAE